MIKNMGDGSDGWLRKFRFVSAVLPGGYRFGGETGRGSNTVAACNTRFIDMNKIPKIVALLFFVSLLPVFGCRTTEYEYVRAYVHETKTWPLRGNRFKMTVCYEFEYQGDTIRGEYSTHKLPVAQRGDSLVLKYPAGKPRNNEVVRVVKVVKDRIRL